VRGIIRAVQGRLDEYLLHMALYGAAILVAVSGLGFLAIAAYLFLDQIMFRPLAALVAGAGMLTFALIFIWLLRRIFKKRDVAPPRSRVPANRLESEIGALLGDEASAWLGRHGKEASLAAFAIGVASGFSPRLRRTLLGLAKDVRDLLEDLPSRPDPDE